MAHAYTPGLKVTERMTVSKRRILPLKGEVVVKAGDKVEPDVVVARTDLPGNVEPINVANILGVPPEDVNECMLKKEGDPIAMDEPIAMTKSFFGLFKSEAKSKIEGTIENISSVTGQVLLRGNPIPVEVTAYLDGTITEVIPEEGVVDLRDAGPERATDRSAAADDERGARIDKHRVPETVRGFTPNSSP